MACRGFLPDSDFLLDLNRSRRNDLRQRAEKLLFSINDSDLYISSVAVTEFLTGVPEPQQEKDTAVRVFIFFMNCWGA